MEESIVKRYAKKVGHGEVMLNVRVVPGVGKEKV